MSSKPTIVVAGFGRCGSSLVMQMLHHGGMPCVGPWPAYEDERTRDRVSPADIEAWRGQAVKILDPQLVGLPGDVRVIWLDRDPTQQAKSHAKFLAEMLGVQQSRGDRRRVADGFIKDRPRALKLIGTRPCLRLRFEDLLADPLGSATAIAAFLAPVQALDAARMARGVVKRDAACRPDLLIESALLSIVTRESVLA